MNRTRPTVLDRVRPVLTFALLVAAGVGVVSLVGVTNVLVAIGAVALVTVGLAAAFVVALVTMARRGIEELRAAPQRLVVVVDER